MGRLGIKIWVSEERTGFVLICCITSTRLMETSEGTSNRDSKKREPHKGRTITSIKAGS
jgi:hypothetical protein